jgi:hypothetical protein
MRARHLLSGLLLTVAACGGSTQTKPAVGNEGGDGDPPAASASVWSALMQPGGKWTMNSESIEGMEEIELHAETVGVKDVDGGKEITLAWSQTTEGETIPLEGGGAPDVIRVGARGVWLFWGQADAEELAQPARFPEPAVDDQKPDGYYTHVSTVAGERVACFGEGPPPGDDTPCEDVCFAEICVGEKSGVVAVDGTWAPDYMMFTNPDYKMAIITEGMKGSQP